MDQQKLSFLLNDLHLGKVGFFKRIGSTNDVAANWLTEGCPNLSLVVADEQTLGRGRSGRKWFTPPGSALALSLVLQADERIEHLLTQQNTARLNGLGALAVCQALQKKYTIPAKIKWPNDIIVYEKKLSGVLTEAQWVGDQIKGVVLGIGINVSAASVLPDDWDSLNPYPFPATCLESALGTPVQRWELLYAVLAEIQFWYQQISEENFLKTWETNLAFLGQTVQVFQTERVKDVQTVEITGLAEDGGLKIETSTGEKRCLRSGIILASESPSEEFHLRPVDSRSK
jgi:BirA family biotin operon repressor/biotin-[acetyl-CoA-carboxylase] ligase